MDKQQLTQRLQELVERPGNIDEEKIFIRLVQQVWQIDWTVAPFDVWTHMIEWDIPYFRRFMSMDQGDEREEEQLIMDWTRTRLAMGGQEKGDRKQRIVNLIEELNQTRSEVRRPS